MTRSLWFHAWPQETQQCSACSFTSSQMFDRCVTRTNGLGTPFGLVAAAQLFSWRASPPGFESSVLLLKDTRRGRRSPQTHSPSGPMGFQWSALCTSPIMANLPTTLLAIGVSTCPNCECTSEESCIACHQCVSYTIRECAHQQSPLHTPCTDHAR